MPNFCRGGTCLARRSRHWLDPVPRIWARAKQVWPIHFFSPEPPDLSDIVASAHRALDESIRLVKLEQDVDVIVGGLVVMSDVGGSVADVGRKKYARDHAVIGLRLGTEMAQLQRGLSDIARVVPILIDHLLSGAER